MVRVHQDPPWHFLRGGIAQLGEHLLCKQGVNGSIPFTSTTRYTGKSKKQDERALRSFLILSFDNVFFNNSE